MLKHSSTEHIHPPRCDRCAFVMHSDTSASGFRCGHEYFQAAPQDRKPLKMDHYAQVHPLDSCEHWSGKTDRVLDRQ
jgi:tRNA(Ile2) C34 agmatinyltransferase TiaS